jgi:hypothetical protein
MRNLLLALLGCALLVAPAGATVIPLINADMETNFTPPFGHPDGWGPNGGWADHAGFARPNNASLGLYFGFYSAGTTETFGQLTGEIIQPNMEYNFKSWAQGGGDNTGTLPYQIGYAAIDGDLSSFVALATATYDLGEAWEETDGVTYTTGAAGPEIGKQLIVRLGAGADGGVSDIWFDNFSASVVPEPASLVLLALGGLAVARRQCR